MTTTAERVALVFEGGGMRATFTSAMAVALLEENIQFPFVNGISAGATNTVNFVSGDPVRARRSFVEFPTEKDFGSLGSWLRGEGYFRGHFIYQETSRALGELPFDFDTFYSSPTDLSVGAFKMSTGESVYFDKSDMATPDMLMRSVRASSTMPVLMTPVEIDGELYVDGALGRDGGIPITNAVEHGYDKFLIIMTRERDYWKTQQKFPAFYRSVFRKYPAVAQALLSRWHRYNETKERVFELAEQGKAYLFIPEVMPVANTERDITKLRATHEMGLAQARKEMPAIKEFLGLT